jgi:hypothetical protein
MQIESNKEYETTPLTTHSTENQMSHNERIRKIQDTEARSPHVCGFVYFVRFRVKDETGEMILTVFDDDGVRCSLSLSLLWKVVYCLLIFFWNDYSSNSSLEFQQLTSTKIMFL